MKHVVIIGNGISGITAARHIRKKSDFRISVISDETEFFYSRTALMYIYMGHMKFEHTKPYEDWFWEKNRIDLLNKHVDSVDTSNKELNFRGGEKLNYDILILASGSHSNKFGWPGQDLKGVSGLYNYQDLQYIEAFTKNIKKGIIVGGGLIGVELAEMLHSRGIEVTFLVRESSFWNGVLPDEESALVSRHIQRHGIDLRLNTELKEIIGDQQGLACSIITNSGDLMDCQFVGLTAGVSPNIDFIRSSEVKTERGILVNEYLETSVPGVYAIGDCAQHINPPAKRKSVEQVWYTGRMQGETVAHSICSNPVRYEPGVWFNSAKFFDLEYQTYGWVWNKEKENEASYYWENKKGDKCLRLVYDKNDQALKGLNVIGIRIRHEVAARWIKERIPVNKVVQNLREANFDPEFFQPQEKQIALAFKDEPDA